MSAFRTVLPRNRDDVAKSLVDIVGGGGDALIVGGGTLTVPALVRGDITATHVVDLGKADLDGIEFGQEAAEIGASVSYQQILESRRIRRDLPLLHRLCSGITGGIQIRNQGTVVGALCAARPQSDIPAALVALGAEVLIHSTSGTRIVDAQTFLRGAEQTDLATGEFVTAVRVPWPATAGFGYVKLKSAESSWPVVTAAAVLPGHVVLGGVAKVPQLIRLPDPGMVRTVVAEHVDRIPPTQRWADLRADWNYRRRVAPEIAARAVEQGVDHV
ncbi:FAD binding domain-containing protein [Mycolicibacterium smegmatis]|uniref:FAD binding domain-containing protein n=1 Tax=Mycolicibacterium smegmatis TaxID=1772 RepID=UPI001E52351B|nr:FAD binding domain-containing protein [Mycolicibacterium smegmatis]UGU32132.1 FAD binding domain-containing protein [Mycolicibacterium smegmatis]ULN73015.1 FAD binding domain-containing protein [Mycolicibacterium smegmatis]